MSEKKLKEALTGKKIACPDCKMPITKYEKFIETCDSVWDGAGDSNRTLESTGSKVTLICANGSCTWKERTEYWQDMIDE